MVVHAAFGGSTNLLLHLPAIAHAARLQRPGVADWSHVRGAVGQRRMCIGYMSGYVDDALFFANRDHKGETVIGIYDGEDADNLIVNFVDYVNNTPEAIDLPAVEVLNSVSILVQLGQKLEEKEREKK